MVAPVSVGVATTFDTTEAVEEAVEVAVEVEVVPVVEVAVLEPVFPVLVVVNIMSDDMPIMPPALDMTWK